MLVFYYEKYVFLIFNSFFFVERRVLNIINIYIYIFVGGFKECAVQFVNISLYSVSFFFSFLLKVSV